MCPQPVVPEISSSLGMTSEQTEGKMVTYFFLSKDWAAVTFSDLNLTHCFLFPCPPGRASGQSWLPKACLVWGVLLREAWFDSFQPQPSQTLACMPRLPKSWQVDNTGGASLPDLNQGSQLKKSLTGTSLESGTL